MERIKIETLNDYIFYLSFQEGADVSVTRDPENTLFFDVNREQAEIGIVKFQIDERVRNRFIGEISKMSENIHNQIFSTNIKSKWIDK